ncbi:ComF family protein [Lentzea albidocapillata]|uniref:Predicted amidophosphoribosyltransferases n=1 Tax=Lentzea albidocapillata TaxID=40571 RepID=A0A1W2EHC9_9PSEU|nr:phosphoribosyltransferase [Lentzea albidocapillata]SMD09114.1 Predicted amidophosphoribosyltransferases [Lentzea albidocapillata]
MSPLSRISESYLNILVPPPVRGPDVCEVCRRATGGFRRCWQCNQHFQSHGAELADEVLPISMAVEGSQLVHVLGNYKNSRFPGVRKQFTNELAGVLATFLARHRRCPGEFDLVTVVPSTRQRADGHPLVDILGRRLGVTRAHFAQVLSTSGGNSRLLRPDEYVVHSEVEGRRVLVIDDQWTSGASLQSSAIALKRAGAARVAGLVIGRRVDAGSPGTFDWDDCVVCQRA